MIRMASIVVVGMLVALAGVQGASAQTGDERAIREADAAWSKAAAAKDLEGTLSFMAEDTLEMAPNAPLLTGKAAARKFWGDMFAAPGFAISWQATKAEVSRGGDLGYSIGSYQLSMQDKSGKPMADRGKYVTIWKKQADGSWKVTVDIFNSDMPAAAGH